MRTHSEIVAYIHKEKAAAEQLMAQHSKNASVGEADKRRFWEGHVNAYVHLLNFLNGGDGGAPVRAETPPAAPAPGKAEPVPAVRR